MLTQGLSCNWREYEALEELLEKSTIPGRRSRSTVKIMSLPDILESGSGSSTDRILESDPGSSSTILELGPESREVRLRGRRSGSAGKQSPQRSPYLVLLGADNDDHSDRHRDHGDKNSDYDSEGNINDNNSNNNITNHSIQQGVDNSNKKDNDISSDVDGSSSSSSSSSSSRRVTSTGVENVPTDPYTFSLLRYASAESDRVACMRSCPKGNNHHIRSQAAADSGVEGETADGRAGDGQGLHDSVGGRFHAGGDVKNIPQSAKAKNVPLRVGYLSYDCRAHPMGRLTKTLLTTHNASKVGPLCSFSLLLTCSPSLCPLFVLSLPSLCPLVLTCSPCLCPLCVLSLSSLCLFLPPTLLYHITSPILLHPPTPHTPLIVMPIRFHP